VRLGAVGFTIGNNAYLGTGSFMNDFWLFDASTHTWTQKANFGGNPKLYATGFSIGSKGYLGTGAETGTVGGGTNDFWQYDTTLNSWTQKNNFAGSVRSEAVGFSIGTHGYIATGTTYWGTGALTDLWQYDQVTDSWTQLLNYPGGLIEEAVGFVIGCNAYIGTGFTNDQMTTLKNDLWEFIDSSCSQSALVANFISSDTAFCTETGKCIHFFDQSTGNPTSWQWIFTGAVPDTSNLQNPDSICYSNPGTYPVTLIVSNGTHSDTLAVTPLIIYGTAPPPPTINVTGGDTLISSHASSYQWYFNGSPIAGATDSFYVATQAGTYAVQITDSLGCTSISSGVVFTGIYSYLSEGLKMQIYPNPVKELLIVSYWSSGKEGSIEIYNVLGEKVYSEQLHPDAPTNAKSQIINCKSFISGIYFIKVANEKMNWIGKFVKE